MNHAIRRFASAVMNFDLSPVNYASINIHHIQSARDGGQCITNVIFIGLPNAKANFSFCRKLTIHLQFDMFTHFARSEVEKFFYV